jgi:hypothetical protein
MCDRTVAAFALLRRRHERRSRRAEKLLSRRLNDEERRELLTDALFHPTPIVQLKEKAADSLWTDWGEYEYRAGLASISRQEFGLPLVGPLYDSEHPTRIEWVPAPNGTIWPTYPISVTEHTKGEEEMLATEERTALDVEELVQAIGRVLSIAPASPGSISVKPRPPRSGRPTPCGNFERLV